MLSNNQNSSRGSSRSRWAVCAGLWLLILTWGLRQDVGQVAAQPNPGGIDRSAALILLDRPVQQSWLRLLKLLPDPETSAIDLANQFQNLLDLPIDACLRPETGEQQRTLGPGVHQPLTTTGFKALVTETLRSAPARVRESYEQQYGPEAARLLALSQSTGQLEPAQEAFRRFGETQAGQEAAAWLASRWFDRGEFWYAAQMFESLRKLPGIRQANDPGLLVRLALCWARVGELDKADETLQDLIRTGADVRFGGQPLPDLSTSELRRAWLSRLFTSAPAQLTHPSTWLVRSDWHRSDESPAEPPLGRPIWEIPLQKWTARKVDKPWETEEIELWPQIENSQPSDDERRPIRLPAPQPLIVGSTAIVRFCDHLAAYDLMTGEPLWRSLEADHTFSLLRNLARKSAAQDNQQQNELPIPRAQRFGIGTQSQPAEIRRTYANLVQHRLWSDLTYGTLSSNGTLVFALEGTGFPETRVLFPLGLPVPPTHPLAPPAFNRLTAIDIQTGKMKWEIGGPQGPVALPAAGTFFLGPPLPIGSQLYALGEFQGEIRLFVVSAQTGALQWQMPLAQVDVSIVTEISRRSAGLSPSWAGGKLICPTGAGVLAAVDIVQRQLAWVTTYRDAVQRAPEMNGGIFQRFGVPRYVDPDTQWRDHLPIISGDHILYTPPDFSIFSQAELISINLQTGKTEWRHAKGSALYVLGVQQGKIIVVLDRGLQALDLVTGNPVWNQITPPFDGRGLLSRDEVLIPLRSGEVRRYRVADGTPLRSSPTMEPRDLGNLVADDRIILSQSPNRLAAYLPPERMRDRIEQQLAQSPGDPSLMLARGQFRLSVGEIETGLADIRFSLEKNPQPATRSLLYQTLLELSRQKLIEVPAWEELDRLAQSRDQKTRLYQAWTRDLQARGDLPGAWASLLRLIPEDLGPPLLLPAGTSQWVRTDRWVAQVSAEIWTAADSGLKAKIEQDVEKVRHAASSVSSAEPLRRYLRYFGLLPSADEARWLLLEKILHGGYTLEADVLLGELSENRAPAKAAKAVYRHIAELIRAGQPGQTARLIDRLEAEFASVDVGDGRTGQSVAAALRQSQPATLRASWPAGQVDVVQRDVPSPVSQTYQYVPWNGAQGPFFDETTLTLERGEETKLLARDGIGRQSWAIPFLPDDDQISRVRCSQHIVAVTIGRQLRVYDTWAAADGKSNPALLWQTEVASEDFTGLTYSQPHPGNSPFASNLLLDTRTQQLIGSLWAEQDSTAVLVQGPQIDLVSLLSGEVLWRCLTQQPVEEVFQDRDHLYVIQEPSLRSRAGNPPRPIVQIVRRSDGQTLATHQIPQFQQRIGWDGGNLLHMVYQPMGTVFIQTDVLHQKEVWQKSFAPQSAFYWTGDGGLLVLQRDGLLTRLKLSDGSVEWETKSAELVIDVLVAFSDREHYTLLCAERGNPVQAAFLPRIAWQGWSGVAPTFRGRMMCVNRKTGELLWTRQVAEVTFDPMLPAGFPAWLLASHLVKQSDNGQVNLLKLLALDRATGREIWSEEFAFNTQTVALELNPQQFAAHLTLQAQTAVRTTLKFTDRPLKPVEEPKP